MFTIGSLKMTTRGSALLTSRIEIPCPVCHGPLFVMTVVLMGLLVANAVANISALAWASAVVLVVTFLLAACVTVKPGGWYDRKR